MKFVGAVVPRPATVAELAPMVEILGLTTNINHAVDRTGAAEHPAARVEDRAPIDAGVWLGPETPGQGRVVEQFDVAGGDVDQRVSVAPTRLDQHDPGPGVPAQPIGEHASRRARADDYIIRLHGRLLF